MQQYLEHQANQIEAALNAHGVAARVTGGLVTPAFVRFDLAPAPGTQAGKIVNLAEELARRPGLLHCQAAFGGRHNGTVRVEVPRDVPAQVHLLSLCRQLPAPIPSCTAVLGLEEEGIPLLLRLGSPATAHVLIAGAANSGKTALARAMALSLAMLNRPGEVQLALIDSVDEEPGFAALAGAPHLAWPPATHAGAAVDLLQELVRLMERREQSAASEPRVAVFVDDAAGLLSLCGDSVENRLAQLLRGGFAAGIHVVVCTGDATEAGIGGPAGAHFPVRLVGKVSSPGEARAASGLHGSGAEKLLGRGDFLLVTAKRGEVLRFQAAWIAPGEAGEAVSSLGSGASK